MTQAEFNRIVLYGTFEELYEASRKYPELLEKCSQQIEAELREKLPPIDKYDYQRLVDRGLEEVETYNFTDDI